MYNVSIEPLTLNLFEGEGAAQQGETNGIGHPTTPDGKEGRSEALPVNQPDAADGGQAEDARKSSAIRPTSSTLKARKAEWDRLISGEYKDLYARDTQRLINRRFKETKALEAKVSEYQPLIDALSQRYGESSTAKLIEKLDGDDAYWTAAADEAGMTVEQYKEVQRLRRENKAFKDAQERAASESAAQQQLQQWYSEAEAMTEKYDGFDLETETQNPDFVSLLRSGVPMETAYRVLHIEEIMSDAMGTAMRRTEEQVTKDIRARGARPTEAGAAGNSGYTVKTDISNLTLEQMDELARRAQRGETITLT